VCWRIDQQNWRAFLVQINEFSVQIGANYREEVKYRTIPFPRWIISLKVNRQRNIPLPLAETGSGFIMILKADWL
jgi:hypothetical protein